jgi:hypothetical protein
MLRSSPFGWLPAHKPVAVRCGYDNLTHSVVAISGSRADNPTPSKFRVQGVNIFHLQIAEPVMRTERARVHVGRALAQHNPNAVPLGQSPIGCILPIDTKPKKVTEILSALIDVRDSEHEGPRGYFDCLLAHPGPIAGTRHPVGILMCDQVMSKSGHLR